MSDVPPKFTGKIIPCNGDPLRLWTTNYGLFRRAAAHRSGGGRTGQLSETHNYTLPVLATCCLSRYIAFSCYWVLVTVSVQRLRYAFP